MTAVQELAPDIGVRAACELLEVPKTSFYRALRPASDPSETQTPRPRPTPPRALSPEERQAIRTQLYSERFIDQAVPQIFYTLLDEGTYLGSIRTMYRLLQQDNASRERRDQRRLPRYEKPELLATEIRQVWTWDITKLRGPVPGSSYHLYVLLDLYSRYVPGWRVTERESGEYAEALIERSCEREGVVRGQLKLHSDRGASMTSQTVSDLLARLDVEQSFSRPYTPNDNAYSESQFKTLKYRPDYPDRFGSLEDARSWCRRFFRWYNEGHHHSGICYLTPWQVHSGQAEEMLLRRHEVLVSAHAAHPERFVDGAPRRLALPRAVWLNPPGGDRHAPPPTSLPKGGPGDEVLTARLGPRPPDPP